MDAGDPVPSTSSAKDAFLAPAPGHALQDEQESHLLSQIKQEGSYLLSAAAQDGVQVSTDMEEEGFRHDMVVVENEQEAHQSRV